MSTCSPLKGSMFVHSLSPLFIRHLFEEPSALGTVVISKEIQINISCPPPEEFVPFPT